VPARGVEPRTY